MTDPVYTLGIDYGTNSVRALVVRCADGAELGTCVINYPSGKQGILLDPQDHHLARQSPADYVFALEKATLLALEAARHPLPLADSLIYATAMSHGAI